jgi:hypothetical protein
MMEQFGIFIGTLMQSRNQAHIYHLQTSSYAQHIALQGYYEGIIPLIDGLVESFQGKYGILRGYKMAGTIKEDENALIYFEGLCKFIETVIPGLPQDTFLVNQYDEVMTLIQSTKYKLKFLH